ncbi:hypothetical protein KBC54_00875 [Patescibacteria group bacterium]|nr:hypothetical protein [Patescibacteria group bacterium]
MEQRSSTSRYILTALAIILVITTFILVGLNALTLEQRMRAGVSISNPTLLSNQGYIEGYKAARKKYAALCAIPVDNVTSFSGTIQAINSNGFTVTALTLDTDSKVDGISDDREITMTSDTKIQKITDKTPAEMAAEDSAKAPPTPYNVTLLQLKDLTVGQTVTVSSATDVRLEPVITATTITVR